MKQGTSIYNCCEDGCIICYSEGTGKRSFTHLALGTVGRMVMVPGCCGEAGLKLARGRDGMAGVDVPTGGVGVSTTLGVW